MDCFEDKATVEAPGEGAEVARQMFGAERAVGGHEAVFDIGEHGVRPPEGRVARSPATGAGDMALMDDAWLLGNAAKPLASVADHSGSGCDLGAQTFGFAGAEPAHDLEAGVQRSTVIGRLDCDDEGRMSASTAPRPFTGAFAADVGVIDLDARASGAELITPVTLEHGLH